MEQNDFCIYNSTNNELRYQREYVMLKLMFIGT